MGFMIAFLGESQLFLFGIEMSYTSVGGRCDGRFLFQFTSTAMAKRGTIQSTKHSINITRTSMLTHLLMTLLLAAADEYSDVPTPPL
jgi:hypothetical protein